MTDDIYKIAFIGGGNMAFALINGLISNGYPSTEILVSDPSQAAKNSLTKQHQIEFMSDNKSAVRYADIVILAVKPQILREVVLELSSVIQVQTVVVSIAAGVPISALQKWFGKSVPIVRSMPNTPSRLMVGATGMYANRHVTIEKCSIVERIFSTVGYTCWLQNEKDIDSVTAVSGSSPAYFFLIFEIMQRVAEDFGLSPSVAKNLILQTAKGSVEMALNSHSEVGELRSQVTSPGGTTEQAIATLRAGNLDLLIFKAMKAALERAQKLSEEYGQ
ncbi:MAG: pyrroline-5-carboxylate reductase [Porticoccaceae bacterium]|nr:pyrroline-5-carboxylate reductase [Porticoccaceae bacterium]